MVSQEKWDKMKRLIDELGEMVTRGPLPLQRMLEIRGFLMYVVRTYTWMNPYIKGMHNTIDSWREGRAEDDFKITAKERKRNQALLAEAMGLPCRRAEGDGEEWATVVSPGTEEGVVLETVLPKERFLRDLEYLRELTSTTTPPKQLYWAAHESAFYVIGDASGKAKGSALVEQYGVDYESGAWNLEWRLKSSNCREVENLTDRLERLVQEGALQNHEVFLITDNSAFKGAYYKGHSPSRELSDHRLLGAQGSARRGFCPARHSHLGKTYEGLRCGRPVKGGLDGGHDGGA
ncbi:hypothetical protein ACHAW5_001788 [Stephanodiscus triporus]|uniref:RNase H type-1 domain-containing protein n=1 Tax=Stephanodiscus triporus TaxID=2934178 RepID=A0ABD3NV76_9STRA